jgi:hypothetical protein
MGYTCINRYYLNPGNIRACRAGVVTFEQFLFARWSSMEVALSKGNDYFMAQNLKVGTILMKEWPGMPQLIGLETEPCFGEWSTVKALDPFALDRKIHAAGWNLFFMATEVKAMFFGSLKATKVQSALQRILAKVKPQHFNGLEVTAIVARHFLGVPYVTVSAHSRHMQHSCNLDSAETRRTSQSDATWARG